MNQFSDGLLSRSIDLHHTTKITSELNSATKISYRCILISHFPPYWVSNFGELYTIVALISKLFDVGQPNFVSCVAE